ncbi:MAG: hypothetical protein MR440_07925 [Firmicutes bacterium]|nr:hypothetical protein [Bacillota bacterium]
MYDLIEETKRNELRGCLIDLSKAQDFLKDKKRKSDCFLKLERTYWNPDGENFRHFYSDIFATISLIDADNSLGDINVLAENMEIVKNGYTAKNYDCKNNLIDIKKEITKLYDHANLDISRINYMKRITEETESEISRNKFLLAMLEDDIEKSNKERENAVEKLKHDSDKIKEDIKNGQNKMQGEYITILGIFASIVLAFTGGLAFSTSVLENINAVNPYRLAFVVEWLAFIFINIIYVLVWFIQKIHDGGKPEYPRFMKILNLILIVAIIITAICWWTGVVEMVEMKKQLKFCK